MESLKEQYQDLIEEIKEDMQFYNKKLTDTVYVYRTITLLAYKGEELEEIELHEIMDYTIKATNFNQAYEELKMEDDPFIENDYLCKMTYGDLLDELQYVDVSKVALVNDELYLFHIKDNVQEIKKAMKFKRISTFTKQQDLH